MEIFGNAHLGGLLKIAIPGLFIFNFVGIAVLIDKCLYLTPAIPGHTITGQDVAVLPAQDSHLAQDVGQEFPTRFFIPVEPLRIRAGERTKRVGLLVERGGAFNVPGRADDGR